MNNIVFVYNGDSDVSINYDNIIISLEYTGDICELNTEIIVQ